MTPFIYHNLIFLEILSAVMPQYCLNASSVFISPSCYAEALFSFPKTCGSSAVSTFRPWPNLFGFNEQSLHLWVTVTSQLLSPTRFVIISSVTWPKKHFFFFLSYFQFIMFSYSLQSVYRAILEPTPSWTTYFPSPNLPLHPLYLPNPVLFFSDCH